MSKEQETMDNFGGFNSAAEIDFFGQGNTTEEVETETPAVVETPAVNVDDTNQDTPEEIQTDATTETSEDTEDISFFEEESEEEEEESKTEVEKSGNTSNTVSLLQQLQERGLAQFELEEGEELTEERAAEILEDSYEASIESRLGDMLAGLPPVTRDLVKFAINGGDEAEFLSKIGSQPARKITKDFDLSDEKNQELVLRQDLAAQGYDDEYIESNIEFLRDSGKMEAMSKKAHERFIKKDEAERAAELKKIEDQKKAMKENKRKFKTGLSEFLTTNKEIKGLKITDKDKDLATYIADDNIKTESGSVSQMQRDLFEALQDREKTVLLAKLLKSDFDFSDIANATKTQTTKKIQDDVRRSNRSNASGSSRSQSKKELADYFN